MMPKLSKNHDSSIKQSKIVQEKLAHCPTISNQVMDFRSTSLIRQISKSMTMDRPVLRRGSYSKPTSFDHAFKLRLRCSAVVTIKAVLLQINCVRSLILEALNKEPYRDS
ncbi:hypothetical protein J6590_016188 [Homalodisca vitripennis]|nr:hypothetical protein J6590_016188 [Homalodisca vitripennis]